jgi:hypothetical protein
MGNLRNRKTILLKGWLFFLLGWIASSLLIVRHLELTTILLLAITIWAFCRFYYFAFYVIEHYVDSKYRFAGLLDFCRYCWSGKCVDQESDTPTK